MTDQPFRKDQPVTLPDGRTGKVSFTGCADENGRRMVEVLIDDGKKCSARRLYYPELLKVVGQ